MNNNLNYSFLKCLIDSDFSTINCVLKTTLFGEREMKSSLNLNSLVKHLSLFELNRNLKQLLRIIQSTKVLNIYIWSGDPFFVYLIKDLVALHFPHLTIKAGTSFPNNVKEDISLFFVIGNCHTLKTKTATKRLVNSRLFVLNRINIVPEKNLLGNYKIYNSLNDFKKILFLLIFISKAIKQKQ